MTNTPLLEQTPTEVRNIVKKGFDVSARLKNRGLRKATITLYLDEELGAQIGSAENIVDQFGNITGRRREGLAGEIDALNEKIEKIQKQNREALLLDEKAIPIDALDKITQKEELEKKQAGLIKELGKSALVIQMRAVPPVIEKNCRRLAKQTLGITTKGIPTELEDEYNTALAIHLMTVIFQKITDVESGESNEEISYGDGEALIDQLPRSQWERLDLKVAEVQYTDAISRSIEEQEDFS